MQELPTDQLSETTLEAFREFEGGVNHNSVDSTLSDFNDLVYEEYTLKKDGDIDCMFRGQILAHASSRPTAIKAGKQRWSELSLYKTDKGLWVCYRIGRSSIPGERSLYTYEIFESVEDVATFFGFGWLAKELYDTAGLSFVRVV